MPTEPIEENPGRMVTLRIAPRIVQSLDKLARISARQNKRAPNSSKLIRDLLVKGIKSEAAALQQARNGKETANSVVTAKAKKTKKKTKKSR